MKLMRLGPPGHERPALRHTDGTLRDLSGLWPDITPAQLSPAALAALAAVDVSRLPVVAGTPRVGCPVAGIGKIVGVGLNYADHARESGLPVPREPVLFLKATSALCGPDDDVLIPRDALKTDWEVELGVFIGTTARDVPVDGALRHVAGYVLANDVSERAFQLEGTGQWDKGKGCDHFAPVGPWLATADEVPDPQALALFTDVNGQRRQDGTTADMVFGVAALVSAISRYMTLLPGDLILTGTPAGVALGQKPVPVYLKPGDTLRLGITGLGEQHARCMAATRD